MIRRRTGNHGRSQYRHEPNAARKRREEIRKRARPYVVILNDILKVETKIPTGFRSGSITTASENVYSVLLPAESELDAHKWMATVEEEGVDGWDHRGNLIHISPCDITEIRVFKNDHR